jgi:MoaA/NifB/PqqE/SkfB family radical SAM enzyme
MRNEYPTPIIGTVDEWIAGARMMRERLNCGPVYFDLCFGDPFGCRETIEIAADLSRDNCVAVTTNLVAQLSDLDILPRNDNVMISPSFHPHYWDGVDQFVEKVGLIRASGLVDFGTIIVTHPSFIKMIPEWKRKMESYGIKVLPSMFFGSYQGKMYPDAFTDEERGFISEMQGGVFDGEDIDRRSGRMITKNRKCAAGVRYFFVRMDGDIRRCIMYGGSLGNLLEGTFYPLSFPEMCEIEECALCYDQWQYIEDGN